MGVPRLDGSLGDGDDDKPVVLGLRAKGEQPLASRKGGFEVLFGASLEFRVGGFGGV
jgi:hypothetical protein